MNRRQIVPGIGLASMTSALGVSAAEESKEPEADDTVDYLFVQNAEAVTLAGGVLTLKDVNTATIFFSDRPDRIVGHTPTDEFVAQWGHGGDDSFAADPPNAALSILNGTEPQDIIVTISNPQLQGGDLLYDVVVLEGNASASGEASSLFIDVIGRPMTPMSVAGVRRRTRRRTGGRMVR
jgi:hypothetical protein